MDELITRYLSRTTTDIEDRQVRRWRDESPENEATFRSHAALWELGEAGSAPRGSGNRGERAGERGDERSATVPPPVDVIVAEAERRRRRAAAPWRAALRSPWTGYGLAAAAVLALLFVRLGADGPRAEPLTPTESTASAGDVVTMSLSDGSLVRLAAASRVEFPPSRDERLVRLSGRAFFAVSPGEAPFVVRTSVGDVTVHGTRFEVSVEDDELRLVVVEGTVTLVGEGGEATVRPGEVAHIRGGREPSVVKTDDVWGLLDWEGGLLLFQETPLRDAGEELGRHFGREVVVGEGVASRRITAWFADEPLDEIVGAVCLVAGTMCEVRDDSIRIGR